MKKTYRADVSSCDVSEFRLVRHLRRGIVVQYNERDVKRAGGVHRH